MRDSEGEGRLSVRLSFFFCFNYTTFLTINRLHYATAVVSCCHDEDDGDMGKGSSPMYKPTSSQFDAYMPPLLETRPWYISLFIFVLTNVLLINILHTYATTTVVYILQNLLIINDANFIKRGRNR